MTLCRILGTVLTTDHGRLVIVPTSPQPKAATTCAVFLEGDLPPIGERVEVWGELHGRVLTVTGLRVLADGLGSAWSTPDGTGVGLDEAQAVALSFSPDWGLLSGGVSTTSQGGHVAVIEVDRMTPEVIRWASSQPADAFVLIPFIQPVERQSGDRL